MEFIASFVRQVSPMWVIGGFLAFFSLLFFLDFVVRSLFLGRQLNLVITGLKQLSVGSLAPIGERRHEWKARTVMRIVP